MPDEDAGLYRKFIIRDKDGTPYLVRRSLKLPFGRRLMLHHILRSDADRHLHDHPWSFVSLVLWGGYFEQTDEHILLAGRKKTIRVQRWRGPGSIQRCPARHSHRVILDTLKVHHWRFKPAKYVAIPAWTLIFRGRRVREWGFHTECGWQRYDHYIDKAHGGLPICEDTP